MIRFALASIVEGHGEVAALPLLLRRLDPTIDVPRPIRAKRQRVVKPNELERLSAVAEANIIDRGNVGGVLLLLDADHECAATLGPSLLARLQAALPHRPVACALAVREFESWLVAGHPAAPASPDESRPGKRWLADRLGRYAETVDQPRLTATFDHAAAQAVSRSFGHFVRAVQALQRSMDAP